MPFFGVRFPYFRSFSQMGDPSAASFSRGTRACTLPPLGLHPCGETLATLAGMGAVAKEPGIAPPPMSFDWHGNLELWTAALPLFRPVCFLIDSGSESPVRWLQAELTLDEYTQNTCKAEKIIEKKKH